MQLRIPCPKPLELAPSIRNVPQMTEPWYNECAVFALVHTISLPSIYHLSIWNPANLNSNLIVTAVAETIVKSPDTLCLVRHATAILRLGNTVGLVGRIAQIKIGRPDIAIYHAHTSAKLSPSSSCHSNIQSIETHRRLCAPPYRCRRCPRARLCSTCRHCTPFPSALRRSRRSWIGSSSSGSRCCPRRRRPWSRGRYLSSTWTRARGCTPVRWLPSRWPKREQTSC